MPQYQTITLTSAIAQLASRLNDSANIYFTQIELQNAITEALRWLQALTGFYRERERFTIVANQVFYDLRYVLDTPAGSTYPYAFSITDNQLLAEIQYHFIEQVANPQTILLQYPVSVIAQALQRNRDQFLTDTGIYITQSIPAGPINGDGRINLAQTVLDVRRAAWQDAASLQNRRLRRTDEYAALGYSRLWPQTADLPYSYSVSLTPPIQLQLIPIPLNTGNLDICSLDSGPALPCTPASPVVLGIPDDYVWGVKYGAMADLLGQDGPNTDVERSQYCRTLYHLAMTEARKVVTVLLGRIEDLETFISGIASFDAYRNGWQTIPPQTPTDLLIVSPNLLALSPTPDKTYRLTLDMVRSMPIPVLGTDFLQIDSSMLEPVLDLSQHIASFKMASAEFMVTTTLRNNFLRMAALMNSRLQANTFFKLLLEAPAQRPELDVPRLTPSMRETVNA